MTYAENLSSANTFYYCPVKCVYFDICQRQSKGRDFMCILCFFHSQAFSSSIPCIPCTDFVYTLEDVLMLGLMVQIVW